MILSLTYKMDIVCNTIPYIIQISRIVIRKDISTQLHAHLSQRLKERRRYENKTYEDKRTLLVIKLKNFVITHVFIDWTEINANF